MKTITPLHLLVQEASGNPRIQLRCPFIKGFSTHYFIAPRMFLPAASARSASLSPRHPIEHIFIVLALHTGSVPSAAVPKPCARSLTCPASLPPGARDQGEVAPRQMTGCWHSHLALVTAPRTPLISSSIFPTHPRTPSLTVHFG